MSADNGIYILQTKGPEYRVAHHQNIEEIYGEFSDVSYQWQGNPQSIWEYFHDAKLFLTLEEALDFAADMSYHYDFLEYGICVITEFCEWDFSKLEERYGKANQVDEGTGRETLRRGT